MTLHADKTADDGDYGDQNAEDDEESVKIYSEIWTAEHVFE